MDNYDIYMQNFDTYGTKNALVSWIRNKMNGFSSNSKAVIGISGGKDSTVVAALCVEALGADRVYGVMMPNGEQADINDSEEVIKLLGIHRILINIANITKEFRHVTANALAVPTKAAMTNMPARVRMTALYMVAQTLGNAFVVNTGNLSESWVGYCTWHADTAGDFAPLANFTSDEVIAIGDACGLPYYLTHKVPTDELSGKTDEDNLGFSYYTLNNYIRTGIIEDLTIKEKIDHLHRTNLFKTMTLDKFNFNCPIMAK